MCGICGCLCFEDSPDPEVIRAMTDTLVHRGPDGKGTYIDGRVGLGHTRLSIIDLSDTGQQPIANEDGAILCVFNGEIYNHKELRSQLKAKGHIFRGTSDSEILPHLYEDEGVKMFEYLRGMFAIAIYDKSKCRLTLGRDRFGIKPLYYASLNDSVVFGSEIKAILVYPTVPKRINQQAIHDYLSLLYVPGPQTAYRDIQEVEPGLVLTWDGPRLTRYRFWSLPKYREQQASSAPNLHRFGALIDESVESQLCADVPIGSMLSGGIDSSLILESASRQYNNGNRMPAFTVSFPDEEYDEAEYALMVAESCNAEHHVLRLEYKEADVGLIEKILLHFDQPFADSSAIPTFLVAQEIRKHAKVSLSGDGGDEIFGGYQRFWTAPAIRRLRVMPEIVRRLLLSTVKKSSHFSPDVSRQLQKVLRISGLNGGQFLFGLSAYLDEAQKRTLYDISSSDFGELQPTWRLFESDVLSESANNSDVFSSYITDKLIQISLAGDMLRKVDMMSMLAGLEVRVPLLDERLTEAALLLSHNQKVRGRQCKWLIRKLAAERIPRRIAQRKKMGFCIPLDRWASTEFHEFIRDMLLDSNTRLSDFLKTQIIQKWVEAFISSDQRYRDEISRGGLSQRIYMLLGLELWMRSVNTN